MQRQIAIEAPTRPIHHLRYRYRYYDDAGLPAKKSDKPTRMSCPDTELRIMQWAKWPKRSGGIGKGFKERRMMRNGMVSSLYFDVVPLGTPTARERVVRDFPAPAAVERVVVLETLGVVLSKLFILNNTHCAARPNRIHRQHSRPRNRTCSGSRPGLRSRGCT